MTNEQMKIAIQKYRELLYRVSPTRFPQTERITPEKRVPMLEHLVWMLDQTLEHYAAGKVEKAMRWWGFIQGVLWSCGLYTIEELANDNREPEGTSDP